MLARTEILKKNGGTTWKIVAYLPTARTSLSGVSIPNGYFLVAGEIYSGAIRIITLSTDN